MEQKNLNNNMIKITLLEINPSLKELEKNNNEISIIFQGINVFYNLSKLISNNTEILINNCKNSLIMSLIKCDNIFASALFNIKPGESWVTFNYESKNKSTIKQSMNNIDCIKIKIYCEFKNKINNLLNNSDNNNKSKLINNDINNNTSKVKRYHTNININNIINRKQSINNNNDNKNHLRYDSILTESSRYLNSINGNKFNFNTPLSKNYSNKIKLSEIILKKTDMSKEKFPNNKKSDYSLITYNHPRLNSSSSRTNKNRNNIRKHNYSNFHSHKVNNKNKSKIKNQINIKNFDNIDNLDNYLESNSGIKNNNKIDNNKIHINTKKINESNNYFYFLNHSPIHSERSQYLNSENNSEYNNNLFFGYNQNSKNKNIKNKNNLNANKNKQIIKNRLFKNNIQGNVTNSYSTATTKKNEFEGSLNSLQDNEDKFKKNKIKNSKHPLTTQREKISKDSFNIKYKSQYQLIFDNNINRNKNENIKTLNSLENNILEKYNKEENCVNYLQDIDDNNDIDLDDFSGLKSDLELLYSKEYIKNIKNDLLNLEIELFAEKMIELISIYHREIEFKIKENIITKNVYKENIKKYTSFLKLNNKLQLIKNKYDSKNIYLNNNNKIVKQQKTNNLLLKKDEFNLFDILINSKNSKINKLNKLNIRKKLKEILNIILNNNKNKKFFEDNFKINLLLQNFLINNNNEYNENNEKNFQKNKKIRTKAIPQKQHTKIISKLNTLNNIEINNDINIINNNFNNDTIYIKKGAKSPLYSGKKLSNQINFNI